MSTTLEKAKERLALACDSKLRDGSQSAFNTRERDEERYARAARTFALVSIAESLEELVNIASQRLHNDGAR